MCCGGVEVWRCGGVRAVERLQAGVLLGELDGQGLQLCSE